MSILIYERDGKTKERIFSFLKKRCVLSVVVANLNYCVDDFLIGKDNFALEYLYRSRLQKTETTVRVETSVLYFATSSD